MAIFLPILSFLFLSRLLGKTFFYSRREACLVSAIICSLWVWLVTEMFSLFRTLNFTALVLAWSVFLTGVIILCLNKRRVFQKTAHPCLKFSPFDIGIIICIFLILLGTFLLSIVSPPNTWDALTYHMSRVAHWAQNGTLAAYPTHIPRQLFYNPGFEYFILNSYLLDRGDAWVSVIQWFAMALSLMVVTLIAKQLGASMRGQLLAAAVAATIPMGIVEASSLQGDLMVAFFLCAAVYALLRWRADASWIWANSLGVTSGLAILTKGIGIIFILPVLIWLVSTSVFLRSRLRWQQALVVMSLVVIVNTGFVLRILTVPSQAFMVARQEGREVLNEKYDPNIFLINVLRNIGTHMGTPSERLNKANMGVINSLSARIGVNIDDPRVTLDNAHFQINKPSLNENLTSAGFHSFLIIVFFLLAGLSRKSTPELRRYGLCLFSMAVLFCLLVKWQPWLSRLQLPLFILASAGIGVLLEKIRIPVLQMVIVTGLFLLAIPYVINAYPRHLLGKKNVFQQTREEQYFSMSKERYKNYAQISDRLAFSGCHDIGLVMGSDDWEYPFWPLLKDRGMSNVRLEHIEVRGGLSQLSYPLGVFYPCARVVMNGGTVEVTLPGAVQGKGHS